MNKIKLDDFLSYRYLSGVKCNDTSVFFTAAKANDDNGYDRNIYSFSNGEVRQLTSDGKAGFYLPYEDALYFTAARSEKEKKEADGGISTIYRLPLSGGEALPWRKVKGILSAFRFLNDGRMLALISEDVRLKGLEGDERKKKADEIKDYEEITASPFYFNGSGYISGRRTFAALVDEEGTCTELFDDGFAVSSISVSEDGKTILFIGHTPTVKPSLHDEIRSFDGKKTEVLLKQGIFSVADAFILEDRLIVAGSDMKEYGENQNPDFYTLEDGNLKPFASWGESMWSSVGSDCRLGSGFTHKVFKGKYYFTGTIRNASHIFSLCCDGKIEQVTEGEGSVDCFDISDDGTIYSVRMRQTSLQELYKNDKAVTDFNTDILKDKYVAAYNKLTYVNDGVDLDGWVLLPKDYEKGRKYPAILDIHGGPKTVYGEVFVHEMQYWANEGYFVLFCNPRGGDGRGNAFMDIRGKYGTIDFDDIMKFVDAALEAYPDIDSGRLGETGGSYGGFMSNWILGHTDRFKAIATQRSIVNWISFWGTSDIGPDFASDQNAAAIEDIQALYERSPMKGILENAVTPTLIIHSDEDYRCPVEQGYQLFNLLVSKGVETKMVLFHGENHELSRSGRPRSRVKRLTEITAWMDSHLKKQTT